MNIGQIVEDISNGEGLNREFKEAGDKLPKNLFETICAILNTDGGTTQKTTQKAAGQVIDEVRQLLQCIDKPLICREIQNKINLKSITN